MQYYIKNVLKILMQLKCSLIVIHLAQSNPTVQIKETIEKLMLHKLELTKNMECKIHSSGNNIFE